MMGAEKGPPNVNFRQIEKFKTNYSPTQITLYESLRTGLRIVVADQEGPKVNGYFTLATEIHDDSGSPHTLEHLCFMGSKSFRYKGFLDKLATRAYSDTNAWTLPQDGRGFAQILPVYLEHVLLPTLTDAGCYTEVHHVDGEGNDAGVVYSEMQALQNTAGELIDIKARRLLYPDDVGFRYETGGMLEPLRVLTADRIRAFHKDMYQPKNLCIVLVGAVNHTNLLDVLDEFEDTILDSVPKPDAPFKRPWVDSEQAPPLKESVTEVVQFPEEDETMGEILISFFGPAYKDTLQCIAFNVLLQYLSGSPASVLDNTIVEKEQLASGVSWSTEFRPSAVIQFGLSGVATENLKKVETRFFSILTETVSRPLDMDFLRDCIKSKRASDKFRAESSANYFADSIINNFLFGDHRGSILKDELENLSHYESLETWSDKQWRDFIEHWLAAAFHVSVLGEPSAELSGKLKGEEKDRIASRKRELGDDGLKHLAEKLEHAKAENDMEVPESLLESYKVPDPQSIHFINTVTARSGAAKTLGRPDNSIQRSIEKDANATSLFVQFEHVESNFALINIMIGTENVPVMLRPLLDIYAENFFSTPIARGGKRVEFEDVVKELERDTVGYGLSSGHAFGNVETLKLSIQVEVENYDLGIRKLREMMLDSVFDLERLVAIIARLLAEIPDEKRSGSDMVRSVNNMIMSAPTSITRAGNTLVRALYLKRVRKLLVVDPEQLLTQLRDVREILCQPSNFRVLVIADVNKLQKPVSAWDILTHGLDTSKPLNPLESRFDRLSGLGKHPGNTAYLVPMPTVDSSFLLADANGPNSPFDEGMPALQVALSYLNAVEGPLWTAVRGVGLGYGAGISQSTDSGKVTLDIYRSPDAFKAFNASKKVIEDFASGARSFEKLALEGAISSIVLSFANSESTMANAAQISFVRQVVRGQPKDWPQIMLGKVRNVTVEEIKKAMQDVLLPIFVPTSSIVTVTCAPIMEEGFVKGFEGLGYKPQVKPLNFFQDDYGYGKEQGLGDDGDDDLDDDEEEDEEDDEGDEVETELR
ncbi:uncharacterized protein KY384_009125 [Bacidia gigantensis]|uniref:uncharacterized protein n=1 Tax=Bacidia gigantensis TaxID=2732470 RepID=UPI001D054A1B|nr:uncharacterized protein KY384_009125 [Bacidia gigantensis]KAG8525481.1 hypothetical protein KY384_009125 [Bacidia gigantensis]